LGSRINLKSIKKDPFHAMDLSLCAQEYLVIKRLSIRILTYTSTRKGCTVLLDGLE